MATYHWMLDHVRPDLYRTLAKKNTSQEGIYGLDLACASLEQDVPRLQAGIFSKGDKGEIRVRNAHFLGDLADPDSMLAVVELLGDYVEIGTHIRHLHLENVYHQSDMLGNPGLYRRVEQSLEIAKRRAIVRSPLRKKIFYEEIGDHGIMEPTLELIIGCAEQYGLTQDHSPELLLNCVLDRKNPLAHVMLSHECVSDRYPAWEIPLLRPISSRPLASVEGIGYWVRITQDAKNKGLASEDERQAYTRLQESVFERASITQKSATVLQMFDMALSHTLMRTDLENYKCPSIDSTDHLRHVLETAENHEWKEMISQMLPIYENLESHLVRYANQESTTLVRRSPWTQNTPEKGVRMIVEPGSVFRGNPEFDLAKMENPSIERHVKEYLEFRSALEAEVGVVKYESPEPSHFIGRVKELAFAHALGVAARKASRGQDALTHILLAQRYAGMQEAWARI